MEDIKQLELTVRRVMIQTLHSELRPEEIQGEWKLTDDLLFDSYSFIGLIVALEQQFNITYNIDDLSINAFETVDLLVEKTKELLSAKEK